MHKEPLINEIPPVEQWGWNDLVRTCKNHKVKNCSRMNRKELIAAVNKILNRRNE